MYNELTIEEKIYIINKRIEFRQNMINFAQDSINELLLNKEGFKASMIRDEIENYEAMMDFLQQVLQSLTAQQ